MVRGGLIRSVDLYVGCACGGLIDGYMYGCVSECLCCRVDGLWLIGMWTMDVRASECFVLLGGWIRFGRYMYPPSTHPPNTPPGPARAGRGPGRGLGHQLPLHHGAQGPQGPAKLEGGQRAHRCVPFHAFIYLFLWGGGGGKVSHVLLGACLLSSTPCDNPLDWAKAHPPPPKHDSTTNPPHTHTTQ